MFKKYLSTIILKRVYLDSIIGIKWKFILLQLFHFRIEYFRFRYDIGNNQSHIRIENRPMRSREHLNKLLELAFPFKCWFD